MKKLIFKNGYEELSLEELKLSIDERNLSDKPFHGVQHYDLIENIGNEISLEFKDFNLNPIAVSNSGPSISPGVSYIPLLDPNKEKSFEHHIFRRLITAFEIEHENEEWNTKLAISYHQNGVEIAFGPNVRVCSNLSIFGYDFMHSVAKTSQSQIYNIIKGWFKTYHQNILLWEDNFSRLKACNMGLQKTFELIGKMTALRVEKDNNALKGTISESRNYALNQSQISKFTENFLTLYQKQEVMTGYDIYNIGTNLHKPGITDVNNIIPQNTEFGHIMLEFI
jgi:hypothetical protein